MPKFLASMPRKRRRSYLRHQDGDPDSDRKEGEHKIDKIPKMEGLPFSEDNIAESNLNMGEGMNMNMRDVERNKINLFNFDVYRREIEEGISKYTIHIPQPQVIYQLIPIATMSSPNIPFIHY